MKRGQLKQNGVHLQSHEYATVKLFLELGVDVELLPPSTVKGFHMPDIMMCGVAWEIKSPQGNSKNTVENILQTAGSQSRNVIIDLRRCKMPEERALQEFANYFRHSKRILRMKIVTKSAKILDIAK